MIIDVDQRSLEHMPIEKIEFFFLGKRKIYILWLQVSMDKVALAVQVVQASQNLLGYLSH
jgi:hypothetical protein